MTDADTQRHKSRRSVGSAIVLALVFGLMVIWLDVYFPWGPSEPDLPQYVVGRYSLLLAFVSFVTMLVERIRHHVPIAALVCLAVAYVGVPLGKVFQTGATAYPWVIAGVAATAGVVSLVAPAYRAIAGRVCAALAVATGLGLLFLA